jgi:hypothetical protein
MKAREEEIGKLVRLLSEKSHGFTKPTMVVIGGYALRAHLPFSRYSRDCDFALVNRLDLVDSWRPKGISLETKEKAFMRWSKPFGEGKRKAKLGLDFMAGAMTGRDGAAFAIDDRFLNRAKQAVLPIGADEVKVVAASYADLFVLKVVSGRPSDVRDLAALVWKNGVPNVNESLKSLNDAKFFYEGLKEKILPEMEHEFFLNSWRGMFVKTEFRGKDLERVVGRLHDLV